jgi:hypothetical protein
MSKEQLIERVVEKLKMLPGDKVREVEDYLEFLMEKYHDEAVIQNGIDEIIQNSKSYEFLKEENDIYTVHDLKERYR